MFLSAATAAVFTFNLTRDNSQTLMAVCSECFFSRSKDDSSESVQGPRFTSHDNGSLEISSVEKGDTGQYTCLAKNTEGSSAIDAMLYVKGKQFFPVKVFAVAPSP